MSFDKFTFYITVRTHIYSIIHVNVSNECFVDLFLKPHIGSSKTRWICIEVLTIANLKNFVKKMFINAFKYKCENFMNKNLY